ncbi:MAG: nitrilase-related carbon-nitrogen hydrolase [bacterium]
MKIKVACFQMDIAFGQESINIEKALEAIDILYTRETGIHFLSFPELVGTGFDYGYLTSLSLSDIERSFEKIIHAFSKKAKEYNVYIQCGSIVEACEGKVYNSAPLIDPAGTLLGTYHKNHLFPLMNEGDFFSPGDTPHVFTTHYGKIGIAICFDVRFPDLFRDLALGGAEIVFVPAQFPVARINHWDILLRARAIENQYFIAGTNRVGKDTDNIYPGHTMLLDPVGEEIGQRLENKPESWVVGTCDLDAITLTRKGLPSFCFSDKRME